jgi:hypothetical protein
MRTIFFSIAVAAVGLLSLPGMSHAQTGIILTNPEKCDFDGDGVSDSWAASGRDATAGLSKRGRAKAVKMKRAWTHFTCRDTNRDGKFEVVGRLSANGRAKETLFVQQSAGQLGKVCKSVRPLERCMIWKSQQSSHISRGDPRHRSTGFITNRFCPGSFPSTIIAYDSKGKEIHRLGEYFPTGSLYDSRHYGCGRGGGDCKDPRALSVEARQRTGKENIYLKDSAGNCFDVPDPGQCFNSSGC